MFPKPDDESLWIPIRSLEGFSKNPTCKLELGDKIKFGMETYKVLEIAPDDSEDQLLLPSAYVFNLLNL